MLQDMKRILLLHPEYTLIYKDASNSTSRQIEQIQELTRERIDLLIVSPNESSAPITQAVDAVFKQDIPVIVLDRRIASNAYNAFISGDNVEIGRLAGSFIGTLLKGRGNVVEVKGLAGSSPAQERHEGFRQQLARFPGVRVIRELNGEWERDTARHLAERELASLQQADVVFAHNEVMAVGVEEVCKKNGFANRIQFVGIDGLPGPSGGMQLVSDGVLKATFLYPTGGEEAIEAAVRILTGKAVPHETILKSFQIDAANVQALKAQSDKLYSQQRDIEQLTGRIQELTETYSSQRNRLYFTLACLLIVVILGAYAFYLAQQKQAAYRRLALQNEEIHQQKDQIEAVSKQARLATEEKLRFYSYISHEFNTPLSLILTPTEELLSRKTLDVREVKSSLSLVQKNAHRLLRLVDQMLDLRKADAGKLLLRAREDDIVAFTQDIIQDFRTKADKLRIDLRFIPTQPVLPLWFDREKLDKVLFNLLSNAFKYTPRGGFIHVRLDKLDGAVQLQVQDNGEGMTPDEQTRVFDLFYTSSTHFTLGYGLGLALSREFVTLHHGDIQVQSEKGKGTTFTIQLPLGNAHLDPIEMNPAPESQLSTAANLRAEDEWTHTLLAEVGDNYKKAGTLLVIEDHDELRQYVAARLGDRFEVLSEPSAERGWERILETIPDLIISDVMLPGISGLQLTQRIKNDFRTSTIPVILLTAKAQMDERIEGTRAGADAYITKPFQMAYLIETINTTLSNREKWQNRYTGDYLAKAETRQEKKFLNELTSLIEQHLTDTSFGVEQLSRAMGLSRVQLYRKTQTMLGKNVNDYFTEIRIKKAKALLTESSRPIAEIAYETGFSSPAYFTTFFKQHTQRTPSEFRKSPVSM
jgi:signal transduction histidine kinase/DNA-binding response OmpR family regulator